MSTTDKNDLKKLNTPEPCVLCGKEMPSRFAKNNPWPLSETGWCCAECNWGKVIPARINDFLERGGGA
jgi:hypothetical protein